MDDLDNIVACVRRYRAADAELVNHVQFHHTWKLLDQLVQHTDSGPSDRKWAELAASASRKISRANGGCASCKQLTQPAR